MDEQPHPVALGLHDEIILKMKKQNCGTRRIAERFKCSVEDIMARVKAIRAANGGGRRTQYKLTPVSAGQHDAAIKRMHAAGKTTVQMARVFGCCDRVVTRRIKHLRDVGELPKRQPKAVAPKPLEKDKRTPQLDALFTKAVMNDIPDARLRELFKVDDLAIKEWKRVLGLNWSMGEAA